MENSYSPSVKKEEATEIDFYDALKAIAEGRFISKKEWNNELEYGFLRSEILHIRRNGEDHKWIISLADISGEDYFILPTQHE